MEAMAAAGSAPVQAKGSGRRSLSATTLDGIAALRADADQTIVLLRDGSSIWDTRPLRWWSAILPPSQFMRAHRSSIAQIRRITAARRQAHGGWLVEIAGLDAPLGVSRRATPELRSRLDV